MTEVAGATATGGRPTPYVVVDLDVLDANIARTAASATARGLALRPHAKTHKSLAVARRQLAAGAVGLTVATVAEAEVFVAGGADDVLLAYPLWVDAPRGARLGRLAERARVTVGVESAESARALARHAGTAVRVLVEVDSGHHRTGVDPAAAGEVAAAATGAGLEVLGVFTFPGHGYDPHARSTAAATEQRALATAAAALAAAGTEPRVVSGGSTPTADLTRAGVLTELRPGVYVFNDAQQVELGVCPAGAVALTAWSTVVSSRDDRVVLDAGSKVLGTDRAPWASGHGRLVDHPDARVEALSEHHATVRFPPGAVLPRTGDVVRVAPNHVCITVNLVDELVVVQGGAEVEVWPVDARGANA